MSTSPATTRPKPFVGGTKVSIPMSSLAKDFVGTTTMPTSTSTSTSAAKGLGTSAANGRGKGGQKRHRRTQQDAVLGITKPSIRRLARRGGVKRISGLVYDETRRVLKVFINQIMWTAFLYCEHAGRKTITAMDILYALKQHGRTLYGFGG
jgi:histone H4